MHPTPERIAAWIGRFNAWILEKFEIPLGRGQHLLYDREVTLVADNLLDYPEPVRIISAAVRSLGLSFSIPLFAREILLRRAALRALVSEGAVTAIGVTLDDETVANSPVETLSEIEYLVGARVNVGIIGAPASFHAIRAFNSPLLSAANLTWYPVCPEEQRPLPMVLVPVAQCYSRFRLHVDANGEIYPCLGLVGIPNCSFGSLDEDLPKTGLGSTEVMAELDEWNRIGPDISAPISSCSAIGGLPLMCQWHRAALGV